LFQDPESSRLAVCRSRIERVSSMTGRSSVLREDTKVQEKRAGEGTALYLVPSFLLFENWYGGTTW
jgi:hypothetical protein